MVSDATARAGATQYMHPPPPSSDAGHLPTTPRNQRTRFNESTPLGRRNSHAEFDSFYDRSMASNPGHNAQFNRSALEDSAMHGRDAAVASAYNMSLANTPRTRHTRVNSLVSPSTRAQHLERTQNALSGGVRGNRGLTVATHSPLEHPNRRSMMGGHSAGIAPDLPMRDTHSDTFAWGLADTSRSRAGSFAFSNNPRQSFQEPGVRTNGAKPEGSRHPNRSSYAGSIQGSSAIGSGANHGVHHRAGSSHVGGASRKGRGQTQQPRSAGTVIRSNWYHKTEMLNDSDLKDQDFSSSDEEDFGKDAVGDLVSQKRLIQKQQRELFDLNLRYKILDKAMAAKSEQPYQEMLVDFERTCAANRRANREIEQMRRQVKELTERNEDLESRFANPPSCSLPHGMSQDERAEFETLAYEHEKASGDLKDAHQKIESLNQLVSRKDADIRSLEDELDRKQKDAGFWETKARNLTESMCDLLKRQLDDTRQQLDARTEELFTAAVSKQSVQSDDEDDASGSGSGSGSNEQGAKYRLASTASLRVENKQLSVKLRNLERDAEEANKQKDAALLQLEQLRAEQRRFNHQSLRPFIRETTASAAQSEKVRDTLGQWNQFKVILPSADEDTTPTKKGRDHNQKQQQQHLLSPSLRIQRNRRRSNTAAVDAMSSFSESPSLRSVSDVVDDVTEQENDSFGFESPSEFSPRQERHLAEVPSYSLNSHARMTYEQD
ncbi:hypothetical protein GGI15_002604 [Coemansia interrupta]|uniref:Uncharacterized protein n=1 Tax=Coemansia interrupta TaxID=1126814 RepID=A0A9W8HBW6_9FUNG|nr:hypothetical protein GGI15_002604 [Coemansia interrupta]